jgi:hypothetical protein
LQSERRRRGVERERYCASTKERGPDLHLYLREMKQAPALTRSVEGIKSIGKETIGVRKGAPRALRIRQDKGSVFRVQLFYLFIFFFIIYI